MVKKIVCYITTIIIMYFISVYTYNYELMYAVLALIVFPLLDILFIKNSANNIAVKIDIKKMLLKKDESIAVETDVINRGILPVVMIQFEFVCKNMLHDTTRNISLLLPILRWGKQNCIFSIKSEFCGDVTIELKEAKVMDYFGFTSKKINALFKKKIYILPNKNNIDVIKVDNLNSGDIEATEFSKVKSGDDPTEVFDIREYRAGDKVHSIHWKLSSRRNEIMVKEYSLPVNSNYSIIMDLNMDNNDMHKVVDSVIEITMNLILKLQEQGINHQIIAYERNGKYVFKDIIDTNASIVDIMYELYQSKVFKNRNLLQDYDMKNEINDETNVYYVSSNLKEEDISVLDSTFINAKKVYVYLNRGEDNKEYVQQLEQSSDVQIVEINVDSLEDGLANICI